MTTTWPLIRLAQSFDWTHVQTEMPEEERFKGVISGEQRGDFVVTFKQANLRVSKETPTSVIENHAALLG